MNVVKRLKAIKGIWYAVLLLYLFSVLLNPQMMTPMQITNLLKISAFVGIAALGHTFVVLLGGVDLSIASVVTSTVIICCAVMNGGSGSVVQALLYCIAMGCTVGMIKGYLIAKLNLLPMIVTLSVNYMITGITLLMTGGITRGSVDPRITFITRGTIGFLPVAFCLFITVCILLWIIQNYTKFGKELYATGANKVAASVNGINTNLVTIGAHIICSLCAVGCGILLTSYLEVANFDVGEAYATNSLACVVVGGTLMSGGMGSVSSSVAGALFVTILNSFLNVARVPYSVQKAIQGIIIIFSIWLSSGEMNRWMFSIKEKWFRTQEKNRRVTR